MFKEWTLLKRLIWLKGAILSGASAAYATVSGAVVSFITTRSAPLKELVVDINPVQSGSGDPSPDNVRPISGWTGCNVPRTGKNLLSNYTPTQGVHHDITYALKAGSKYIVTAGKIDNDTPTYLYLYKSLTDDFSNATIAGYVLANKNANVVKFNAEAGYYYSLWSGNGTSNIKDIMLELGTEHGTYEPYTGTTYSISWQTEAGTVYGGTLTVNEDGSGVLTQTAVLDVFNEHSQDNRIQSQHFIWPANSNISALTTCVRGAFNRRYSSEPNLNSGNFSVKMCNIAKHYFAYNSDTVHWYINGQLYLFLPQTICSTTQEFLDYLDSLITAGTPLSVWLPLATAQTYNLTAQQVITALSGQNYLWADTGNVSVTYRSN